MKFLLTLTFIFIFTICGAAQVLPYNFVFDIKDGKNGDIVNLMPENEAMAEGAQEGNAFQALGILAQPKAGIYGLIFINAQKFYQFDKQKAGFVTLKLDTETLRSTRITKIKKKRVGKLAFEVLSVKLPKSAFDKLMNSNSVLFTYGSIQYELDQDNLDAFKYVKKEIAELLQALKS